MPATPIVRGLVAALFFACRGVIAAGACPNELDSEFSMNELAAYEKKLQGMAALCEQDARFLAWHGAVLKWLGDYPQAAELLELALMRAPGMHGARIDYADTLAALGDAEAGYALVSALLAEPELPPSLRSPLEARRQRWRRANWRASGQVTARYGYDNNLNNATRAQEINLSFPDGSVAFMLGPANRARAGQFGVLELTGEAELRLSARDSVIFFGDLRGRLSAQQDTDYAQGELDAIWRRRRIDNEEQWFIGFNSLAYDGTALFRQWRLGYTWESRAEEPSSRPAGALPSAWAAHLGVCHPNVGTDVEMRQYPMLPVLDNTFAALRVGYACRGDGLLRTYMRLGRETADGDRPGGDAWRLDARLVWRHPLLSGWLENDFSYAWQWDDRVYSPLLNNGARRHVERLGWRMEYQWPLTRQWMGLLSLDVSKQYSNIELFTLKGQAVSLGLRHVF